MKRNRLELDEGDDARDPAIVHYFNNRVIGQIPLVRHEDVLDAAAEVVAKYNFLQPEEG